MQFFLAFLVILPFVIYRISSSPTIGWVDSGVIATAAHTLGIANPPGFPLYMLIGHFFTKIPLGSVVNRLEILSHLSSIGTLIVVFFFVRNSISGKYRNFVALFASIALAFSYNFWSQATNVETYSFTNFLIFGLLFGGFGILGKHFVIPAKAGIHPNKKDGSPIRSGMTEWRIFSPFLIFSFILGLAMGANPIIAALLPALAWFVWTKRLVVKENILLLFLSAGLFVLGILIIYSYLPIRAATHPFLDWGDPVTLARIKTHLVGGGLNVYEPSTNSINGFTGQPVIWVKSFLHFWHLAMFQFTPILFPLVMLGWWKLKRLNKTLFGMLTILVAANLTFVTLYYGGNQESWMIPVLSPWRSFWAWAWGKLCFG